MIAVVVGFFVSLFNIMGEKKAPKIKKTFKPGKYIASKTGKTYHAPKCEWAKKIKKKNVVWYDNDKEAKKAGLKAHSCL